MFQTTNHIYIHIIHILYTYIIHISYIHIKIYLYRILYDLESPTKPYNTININHSFPQPTGRPTLGVQSTGRPPCRPWRRARTGSTCSAAGQRRKDGGTFWDYCILQVYNICILYCILLSKQVMRISEESRSHRWFWHVLTFILMNYHGTRCKQWWTCPLFPCGFPIGVKPQCHAHWEDLPKAGNKPSPTWPYRRYKPSITTPYQVAEYSWGAPHYESLVALKNWFSIAQMMS